MVDECPLKGLPGKVGTCRLKVSQIGERKRGVRSRGGFMKSTGKKKVEESSPGYQDGEGVDLFGGKSAGRKLNGA